MPRLLRLRFDHGLAVGMTSASDMGSCDSDSLPDSIKGEIEDFVSGPADTNRP